jgi:MFS family permease
MKYPLSGEIVMRDTFTSLFSLFLSCFILLLGTGLINVLLPVRMDLEGNSTQVIGFVLSLYFVGSLIGAIYSTALIKRSGHIRMFSGCVALAAVSILICSLYADAFLWGAMRIVMGFCIACTFTAMESWLSDSSSKKNRGQVLAIHNAVMLAGLFAGQFFMNVALPQDNVLFVIAGIILCTAVIPVALSQHSGPIVEDVSPMPLVALYKRSPIGVISCLISGMIYSAIFNLLPIFAKEYGIIGFELSLYMGAAIFGAFILQFPVGYLSDKFDRRSVLLVLLVISSIADFIIVGIVELKVMSVIFLVTMITSGIIACTYPMSVTLAFDRLRQKEMVSAMASMVLTFAIGGIIGPYSASLVMEMFGTVSLFYFLAIAQLLLGCFVIHNIVVTKRSSNIKQGDLLMQANASVPINVLEQSTSYPEFRLNNTREKNATRQ